MFIHIAVYILYAVMPSVIGCIRSQYLGVQSSEALVGCMHHSCWHRDGDANHRATHAILSVWEKSVMLDRYDALILPLGTSTTC